MLQKPSKYEAGSQKCCQIPCKYEPGPPPTMGGTIPLGGGGSPGTGLIYIYICVCIYIYIHAYIHAYIVITIDQHSSLIETWSSGPVDCRAVRFNPTSASMWTRSRSILLVSHVIWGWAKTCQNLLVGG